MPKLNSIAILLLFLLSACATAPSNTSASLPTATLAPILSQTPRLTATPVSTRTPLPTFTPIPPTATISPTPSDTPTPTEIPPIVGVVNSVQNVNVRSGPGVDFSDIIALAPNTRVEVLGQSNDGRWFNVLMNDGQEGWIATSLLRLLPTPTPFPTLTPSPDLTLIAAGSPLPTSVLGGGTVTPTPPGILFAQTPTPISPSTLGVSVGVSPTLPANGVNTTPILFTLTPSPTLSPTSALAVDSSVLPVIDILSIEQTATALSAFIPPTSTRLPVTQAVIITPDAPIPTLNATAQAAGASVQNGVDVFAYCDNPNLGSPPSNLAAGSTIEIVWQWFATTEQQVRDHLSASVYDVKLDGIPLRQINNYRSSIKAGGNGYFVEWYVPAGPLATGEHVITYSVTWTTRIFDGYDYFGPGSTTLSESGTCTFTVQG